jgi:hypothetical protein
MASKKTKRIQLNLLVTGEMKKRIAALARKAKSSQGQVAEDLMLKQFAYEELVAAMGRGLEEIRKGNVEAELHRLGYTRGLPMRDASGKVWRVWFELGDPRAPPPSGFVPWNEGEQPRGRVEFREDEVEAIAVDEGGEEETGQ